MKTLQPPIDFSEQTFFIGIDVHLKRWKVTIRSLGIELKTFSMDASPDQLVQYMQKHYPGGTYRSVYEAGYFGFWINSALNQHGIENLVVHPADVPTTDKERTQKNDKRDSRKLARTLEQGQLKALFVPSIQAQQLRSLCRLRFRSVGHQTRLKNRIKGMLRFYGYPLPERTEMGHWSRRFIEHLRGLSFVEEAGRDCRDLCLDELVQCRQRIAEVTRRLRLRVSSVDQSAIMAALLSVPGIGPVTGLTFYCELIDIRRFKRFDHLASYVGLVPSTHDTGENVRHGGLSYRRNRYLRALLVEAAWVAVAKDPAMTLAFAQLSRRMKKQEAIIRIAKKLLRRIRHVWLHRTVYESGRSA
jgi:transposase